MSNGNAFVACCSNDADAMHRLRDFNLRRLRERGAFLGVTQKPAWLKGFFIVVSRSVATRSRGSRASFSMQNTRE